MGSGWPVKSESGQVPVQCSQHDARPTRNRAVQRLLGGTRMTVDALLRSVMARIWTRTLAAGVGVTLCVSGVIALAQANAAALEVLQIRPNFYMIVGAGANIAAQIGPNSVALVNTGTAEASWEVGAAAAKLTNQPIRYTTETNAATDVAWRKT